MQSLPKTDSRFSSGPTQAAIRPLVKQTKLADQPISFAKHALLRGLVTDLRPGIVKIHLANKQAIVAKLEGTNEVSIGDVAAFKILDNDNGKLTLKKLNSTVSAKEAAIQKALEEADLPTTEINHTIVKELLYHKLPINKETINSILKKTEDFPGADVDTIVYLTKQGIPLEEEYLTNFDSYKQFDHHLMEHIREIGTKLTKFLTDIALQEPTHTFLPLTSSLFSFLEVTPLPLSNYLALFFAEQDTEAVVEEESVSNEEPVLLAKEELLSLTGKEQKQLLKLFASYDLPEDYVQALKNGQASLRETIQYLSDVIRDYSLHNPSELSSFRSPFVLSLWDQFSQLQQAKEELGGILSTTDRQELLDVLNGLPIVKEDLNSLYNGEMTVKHFLSLVSAFTTPDYASSLRALFGTQGFGKLVMKRLSSLFSLTPEQLSENANSVTVLYNSLVDKRKELTALTDHSAQTDATPLKEKLHGLEQNLNFMEEFNKLFTYIQLPIKLKEQITHGDLYVYTDKKKLKSGQKDISVLLHLDMTQLGALDIYLSLTANNVKCKFYVPEKETVQLMQRNVKQLSAALLKKGFQMESEFLLSPGKPDLLKDLVEKEQESAPIKRYSFDIRT